MKPLRLTLQAFGSYADQVTVDFARLSRHGIFAIGGPTGAGKSTIFDALVYALYDDLPGFRVDGNVRSQYASDTVETRVRLEFETGGEQWAVERTPTQHLRRRRGQGAPIERKSTVLLERMRADGTPGLGTGTSRKGAVAEQIDALIGLSQAQFEQVVLIPQGRFEEVLKADTRTRAVLLSRLFPVEVYGRVTAALKVVADDRQRAFADATWAFGELVERLRSSLAAALEAAGAPVAEELSEAGALDVAQFARHLSSLSAARTTLERAVTTASSDHDGAVQALADARAGAASWDRWQEDLAQAASFGEQETSDDAERAWLDRARRVADLAGALQAWEGATRSRAQLEPEYVALRDRVLADGNRQEGHLPWLGDPALEEVLADAQTTTRLAERLRHLAETLRADVERFESLACEARSLETRAVELQAQRGEVDQRSQELEGERQRLQELSREAEALEEIERGLAGAEAALGALEAERDSCLRRVAASQELERAGLARDEAATSAIAARRRLVGMRDAWQAGLAGRLAELLVDGDPCPTCGGVDHPSPAQRHEDAPDDAELAGAEAASEAAQHALREAEARHALACGALGALPDARPLQALDAELSLRREEVARCRHASERLGDRRASLMQRRAKLETASAALETDRRQLERDAVMAEARDIAHQRSRADFVQRHGAFVSPAGKVEGAEKAARDLDRLAQLVAELDDARATERQCLSLLTPLLGDLGVDGPASLTRWRGEPDQLAARAAALATRAELRAEVRHRIAEYEAAGGPSARPDLESFESTARAAQQRYLDLVRRQAVMEDSAGFFAAGPSMLETATKEVDAARKALEQARTTADRCAGAAGGARATRLSLENWVLADYLRQVLVQANQRLATMSAGRFALQLTDGVTDGRKPWGLELSAFDAYTGHVRPATTLSGGETFMGALALALGLADVVSGGSNRRMGALFVDEGFGSLDPESLEAVLDVLRSLEDGGRMVGVVSHVEAVQQALPSGITVRATPCGSVAEVHYPPA